MRAHKLEMSSDSDYVTESENTSDEETSQVVPPPPPPAPEIETSPSTLPQEEGATRGRRFLTPWQMVQRQKHAKKNVVLHSDEEIRERFRIQNQVFTLADHCVSVTTRSMNYQMSCNCFEHLKFTNLEEEDERLIEFVVPNFQLYFARLPRSEQIQRFKEWMQYA